MRKRNKIGLAVAAALSIGAATQTAHAANLASNGVGELAYVPYYSTKDGKETYVRLVNNGFDTLIVKLKIREGVESIDARDFYIFLSPRDIWTARVYNDANGVRIHTNDTSCTVPSKVNGVGTPTWQQEATGWSINIPDVKGRPSLEGYIVAQVAGTSGSAIYNPFDNNTDVASLVKHINGVPRNCPAVSAAFEFIKGSALQLANPVAFASVRSQFTEPTNALSAAAAIVNPVKGTLTDLPVTVVANVYNPVANTDGASGYLEAGNDDRPNDTIDIVAGDFPDEVRDVTPIATIFDDASATANTFTFTSNVLPVSAALMHSSVMNNLDTTGANSWVVTFPTKKHHGVVAPCSAPFPIDCQPNITPLQHSIRQDPNSPFVSYVTNEEESEFVNPVENEICFSGVDLFDPEHCPTGVNPDEISLPNEVNVVTFKGGNPLQSELATDVSMNFLGDIVFGWMQMRFTDAQNIQDAAGNTVLWGLPVIGFAYTEYPIDGVTTMSQEHTYTSPLQP